MDKKKALSLLVREIGDQIDIIYSLKAAGFNAEISKHVLTETTSVLKELPAEMQEMYFNILIEVFSNSLPSDKDRFNISSFQDANNSLKEKMEAKIIENHKATAETIHKKVRLAV